jgi:hypothetical protein
MNVIDYIMITCNLKNVRLQIASDYMKKCNRLQLITITPCLHETMAAVTSNKSFIDLQCTLTFSEKCLCSNMVKQRVHVFIMNI